MGIKKYTNRLKNNFLVGLRIRALGIFGRHRIFKPENLFEIGALDRLGQSETHR